MARVKQSFKERVMYVVRNLVEYGNYGGNEGRAAKVLRAHHPQMSLQFKHVERPKDWNIPALKALFELLGMTPGMAQLVTQGNEEPVQQLQKEIVQTVKRLVIAQQLLQGGLVSWGRRLIPVEEAEMQRTSLSGVKTFLESLQPFSSPGKLKNFRNEASEVKAHAAGLRTLRDIEALHELVTDLGVLASYLSTSEAALPNDHDWIKKMGKAREEILAQLGERHTRAAGTFRQQTQRVLDMGKKGTGRHVPQRSFRPSNHA